MSRVELDGDFYIFQCPHCNCYIQCHKNDIACTIFRHAVYKNTFQQINPHTPKQECDRLFQNGLVFGCGKPFKFHYSSAGNYIATCEYL